MHPIKVIFKKHIITVELNESKTASAIHAALPIESSVNTWGEEIYFTIPVEQGAESPTMNLEAGDVGYWPVGHAFCIFFGKTPASKGEKPVPASPVNLIGKLKGKLDPLFQIEDGEKVKLEKE